MSQRPDRPTRVPAPGAEEAERGADTPSVAGGAWMRPSSGRGPGVLVLARGQAGALVRESCARLARNGFVAFAPELPEPGEAGPSAVERERVDAALHALLCEHATDGARVGVLGFGRGGLLALDAAARAVRVAVAVSLDGRWPAAATSEIGIAGVQGVVLALFAGKDTAPESEGAEDLACRLRDEGVTGEVRGLAVEEGYLDPDRPDRYDAVAARASWDAALARLRAEL